MRVDDVLVLGIFIGGFLFFLSGYLSGYLCNRQNRWYNGWISRTYFNLRRWIKSRIKN